LRMMVVGADRPLDCYGNGRGERRAANLFKMIGNESVKRQAGTDSDEFYLKTLPLLLVMTKDSCDYSNDVINNIEIDKEIARLGYADGHRALFEYLLGSGRFEELTRAIESEHLVALAPVLEEVSVRGGMPFGVNIFGRDATPVDGTAMADSLVYMLVPDMRGNDLTNWINTNIPGPSATAMFGVLNTMPEAQRSLVSLSIALSRLPDQEVALRNLKNALTRFTFNESYENDINAVVTKIFKNEPTRRGELKDLAQAFVKSMGDSRGGVGDMLNVLSQATGLAQQTPVQDIASETLKDQELVDRVTPILWRLLRDEKFKSAINFTGRLAGAGELEKLIQFAVDLFKNSQAPGLPPDNHLSGYHPSSGNPWNAAAGAAPPNKPPRDQYKACIDLRGSLFDFQGQNLFDALKCTDADGTNPELSAVADHLKGQGGLPAANDILRVMMSASPYTLGTLSELETLFRSGDLDKLFQLFALSADGPYQLPYRLDGVLNDAFRHRGMPQALRLTGRLAQLQDLSKAGSAAIDVWTAEPHKIFTSQNDFRLKVAEPDKVRSFIRQNYPQLNAAQVEQMYQTVRENFETHNAAWKYVEGSYPPYDDTAWKNDLIGFLQDMLRTTDLRELILALQDIARTMHPAKFLSEAIDDQHIVLQHDDEGNTHVHILSLLDQLEELTDSADFTFSVLGFNVGHVGVKFQLAVAKATDLVAEMEHQHTLTKLGLDAANLFHKHREADHFKNMLANYDGLSKIAASGDLRIFQRLYQALYYATPNSDKNKADAKLNHMAALNRVNRLGMFQNLTMGLASAKRQGQLETIVNGLMGLTLLIKDNDIEPLRQTIAALLQQARGGNTAPVEYLLDKLLSVQQNPQGYAEFKDALFHVVPALYRLNVDPTGLFKAMPAVVAQPRTFHDFIDAFIADTEDPAGSTFKIGANMMIVDDATMNSFRDVAQLTMSDEPGGENDLPAAIAMVSDGYAFRPDEYSRLWQTWKTYVNDSRVTAYAPAQLFKEVLARLDNQSGLGDGLAYVLLDDNRRKELITLGYDLTQTNDVAALSKVLVRAINDGDVDAGLHFIFDNLGSSSVRYNSNEPQIRAAPPGQSGFTKPRRHRWW
jgi:hypothetical protein